MTTTTCDILFRPASAELKFLPDGPYSGPGGMLSWVAIQHGPDATDGSLNLLDIALGQNHTYQLPGRPGFAFPTTRQDIYVVGAERSLGLLDFKSREWTELTRGIDCGVSNTIIDDGVVYHDCLLLGCKDLDFATSKAGL